MNFQLDILKHLDPTKGYVVELKDLDNPKSSGGITDDPKAMAIKLIERFVKD